MTSRPSWFHNSFIRNVTILIWLLDHNGLCHSVGYTVYVSTLSVAITTCKPFFCRFRALDLRSSRVYIFAVVTLST